jgi:hypothetical protein
MTVTVIDERPGVVAKPFAHTSPYGGCWLEHYYSKYAASAFKKKVVDENELRRLLATESQWPDLMIMGNFVAERAGIVSVCRELGINTIHSEDGFLPHYSAMHADPLGFCWESSLPRMTFRSCSGKEHDLARSFRKSWMDFGEQKLPEDVRAPYVFWPLQLIGDGVNAWDLALSEWSGLIRHFRQCLPAEFQLVIKPHPRSGFEDANGVAQLAQQLPNVCVVPPSTHLKTLIAQSSGVAGANSSVLYESRLMFNKPVYAYARGWFTNHTDLFSPVHYRMPPRKLPRIDFLTENTIASSERLSDYSDWFLCQLLARQFPRDKAESDRDEFLTWVDRLSYDSYVRYGEDIFRLA